MSGWMRDVVQQIAAPAGGSSWTPLPDSIP
jgi:hypothetical protein